MVLGSMSAAYANPTDAVSPRDDYASLMPRIDVVEAEQAAWLGETLYCMLRPTSVIDWGCASGLYLLPFKYHAAKVCGIDGEATGGSKLDAEEFFCMDMRRPIITDHYDLALCIEVAEHIQEEYADTLVDNVTRSADVVLWTAARPGQGGHHHHNEQPLHYWAAKFARRGFVLHPANNEMIDKILNSGKCVRWMRRNVRLYVRI